MTCRYNTRLYGLLRDFGARFAGIDAIYQQTMAAQRLRVEPQWWKRLWAKFRSRFTSESVRIMAFMSSLDENEIIDITSDALNGMLPAHKRFAERHEPHVNAAAGLQRNRISERRQLGSAAPAAVARSGTCHPLNTHVADGSQKSVSHLASAPSVRMKNRRDQSLSHISRVESTGAADANSVDNAIPSRFRQDAKHKSVELEEVVVLRAGPPFPSQQRTKDALDHNQVHPPPADANHVSHVDLWKDSVDDSASSRSGDAASAEGGIDPQRRPDQRSNDIKMRIARRFKDVNTESEPNARENSQFNATMAPNGGSPRSAGGSPTHARADQV